MQPHPRRRLPGAARALVRRTRERLRGGARADLQPRLRFDPDAPELLLSPHWDDAVLSCWSVLTGAADVTVVNVFAGLPPPGRAGPWEAVAGLHDSRERATLRMQEDERALALAARVPLNLSLLEARHRGARSGSGLHALDEALVARAPSASRVYAPAGIGAHADHLLARAYARTLVKVGMPVTLYAELPYCITHGWPSWVDGREPQPHRDVEAYWRTFLRGVAEMPALQSGRVARLEQPAAASKLAAIDCYRLSLSYSYRTMLAEPALHGFEVLWELELRADGNAL